jgi:hypothetical protein
VTGDIIKLLKDIRQKAYEQGRADALRDLEDAIQELESEKEPEPQTPEPQAPARSNSDWTDLPPRRRQVLEFIRAHPGATQSDLDRAGMTGKGNAYWLRKMGLIEHRTVPREHRIPRKPYVQFYPTGRAGEDN